MSLTRERRNKGGKCRNSCHDYRRLRIQRAQNEDEIKGWWAKSASDCLKNWGPQIPFSAETTQLLGAESGLKTHPQTPAPAPGCFPLSRRPCYVRGRTLPKGLIVGRVLSLQSARPGPAFCSFNLPRSHSADALSCATLWSNVDPFLYHWSLICSSSEFYDQNPMTSPHPWPPF